MDRCCNKCGLTKPLEEFHRRHDGRDGRSNTCRVCKLNAKLDAAAAFHWGFTDRDLARFRRKVRPAASGCHEWTSSKGRNGYGLFYLNGRQLSAHRIALLFAGRPAPEYDGGSAQGAVVDHICGNAGCVNVDHLRVVSQEDNCVTLARGGVFKRNKEAKECINGHGFTPENTAVVTDNRRKPSRACLTCYPNHWMFAIVPRPQPKRARGPWRGPAGATFVTDDGFIGLW